MSKECKIYYATVVEESESKWASKGSVSIEPVKVVGREPLGKDPEFCCMDLEDEVNKYNITYYFRLGEETGFQMGGSPGKAVHFCPFCGARIIFKEHLKLRVVETTHTAYSYHYEVVE